MSLVSLINQHALSAAQAGDWSAVADTLNALTREVRDPQPWNYAKIGEAISPEVQFAAAAYMAAAAKVSDEMAMSHQLLLLGDGEKTGFRLDDDHRQGRMQAIIDAESDPQAKAVLTAIKSLGRRTAAVLPVPTNALACEAAWRSEQVRLLTEKWHQVDQQVRAEIANQTLLAGDVASRVAALLA